MTSGRSNATRNGAAAAPVTSRIQIVPLRFNVAAARRANRRRPIRARTALTVAR